MLAAVEITGDAVALPVTAAHAQPTGEVPTVRSARIDAAQLLASAQRSDKARAASPKLQARIAEHLADQARRGRILDERAVTAATVPDPFTPGAQLQIIWDGAKVPQSIALQRADFADGSSDLGMGIELADTEAAKKAEPGAARSGYSAGRALNANMYRLSGSCTTTWFVPTLPSDRDHKLVSCFEKWALRNTDKWVYNRWALWTPGVPTTPFTSGQTVDFTVKSRPWSGQESRIVSLTDWEPRSLTQTCDSIGNVELGGSYGGISGSVSIPMNRCQDYWLQIDTTRRSIGIDYLRNDSATSGRPANSQMYMDVGGSFTASNTSVVPTWADYNWVTFRACTPSTCGRENWVVKDSGW